MKKIIKILIILTLLLFFKVGSFAEEKEVTSNNSFTIISDKIPEKPSKIWEFMKSLFGKKDEKKDEKYYEWGLFIKFKNPPLIKKSEVGIVDNSSETKLFVENFEDFNIIENSKILKLKDLSIEEAIELYKDNPLVECVDFNVGYDSNKPKSFTNKTNHWDDDFFTIIIDNSPRTCMNVLISKFKNEGKNYAERQVFVKFRKEPIVEKSMSWVIEKNSRNTIVVEKMEDYRMLGVPVTYITLKLKDLSSEEAIFLYENNPLVYYIDTEKPKYKESYNPKWHNYNIKRILENFFSLIYWLIWKLF